MAGTDRQPRSGRPVAVSAPDGKAAAPGTDPLRVAVLGLGEAGAAFASGIAEHASEVRGFDPADVGELAGVTRCDTPARAVSGADVVLALTHAAQAITAAQSALDHMRPGAYYADFATGDAGLKRDIAALAHHRGARFIDGAIMNPVPLLGAATPVDISGDDPGEFARLLTPAGLRLQVVGTEPGVAATRKLLRSVLIKGLSALVIESMRAAETAGMADWFREHLFEQLCGIDREFVVRLVAGNVRHSQRRVHEMEAAAALLSQLGEPPLTAEATRQVLASVPDRGVPDMLGGRCGGADVPDGHSGGVPPGGG
jgi:3-hydroxyisobutyrate dehydrogenase-like beta-hydroxyacid dehydrogenase